MSDVNWSEPDYSVIYAARANRIENMRANPEIIPSLKAYYKARPVDFINDWGMTFDPRNAEIGLPTIVPFLLFPRQEEFIQWLHDKWSNRDDGLAEKSRDMGVSWLCVAFAVWMWLFYPGTVPGFGSRKEEYVDKLGDPKSLFWKIRQFIDLLPQEFKPAGYQEKQHAPYMRVINPENNAVIVGESGDNIGRGNRTSIYFKDESAFYDRPELIDAALSQTSNCKIDVSTPNGNGNPFYRKRHGGKISVFTFHWTQDPRKSQSWYDKQCASLDPVIVAQEIDIDYNASVNDAWIHGELISSAQRIGPADVDRHGAWIVSIDAAHFGDDESVIHLRKGRLNLDQITLRGVDGVSLASRVVGELSVLSGGVGAIIIELDGPGVSCYDQLMQGEYSDYVIGVHTGARRSDDKNYNLRALMWRKAKQYLEEGGVCLPDDPELKSQLASLKFGYKNGLLLMQAKKEYKKNFGKSPDRADAFVLSFAAEEVGGIEEDYYADYDHYIESGAMGY
jgi:hypothetical protein